jgi:hypothetical protein
MGLDWMLYGRPRPEHREEFDRLTAEINLIEEQSCRSTENDAKLDELAQRRDEIALSPWEEVGCPQIGRDEEADAWLEALFHDRHSDPDDEWSQMSYEDVVEDCKGIYVEDLAKISEGIAMVQGPLAGALNFRGKVVASAEQILGDDLPAEAYENHSAAECLDFAARIDQRIGEYLEGRRRKKDEVDLAMLLEAVRWLRFWGGRGFGYDAWY